MTDSEKIIDILHKITIKIEEEKDFLTELDNVIGDGDHGINLARGFGEVEKKLDSMNDKDIGSILKSCGMTLVSTVGGASGPLYGTAFMKAGSTIGAKGSIEINDFIDALLVAIEGIKTRGRSTVEEKTMLDAMVPSYDAMKAALDAGKSVNEIFSLGVDAAKKGVEHSKELIATKGRASYLGDRSIGHQDPGATSYTMILEVIASFY